MSILFLRHYDYLMHYGLQIGAERNIVEECIQELFMYLFVGFDRFGEVILVRAYLFKSLRRRVLECLKKEQRLKELHERSPDHIDLRFSDDDLDFKELHANNCKKVFLEALNRLPWRQREAIYLRYYNGLSTSEIAEIMNAANQTVLNTLYQALKKLRTFDELKNLVWHS